MGITWNYDHEEQLNMTANDCYIKDIMDISGEVSSSTIVIVISSRHNRTLVAFNLMFSVRYGIARNELKTKINTHEEQLGENKTKKGAELVRSAWSTDYCLQSQ